MVGTRDTIVARRSATAAPTASTSKGSSSTAIRYSAPRTRIAKPPMWWSGMQHSHRSEGETPIRTPDPTAFQRWFP